MFHIDYGISPVTFPFVGVARILCVVFFHSDGNLLSSITVSC